MYLPLDSLPKARSLPFLLATKGRLAAFTPTLLQGVRELSTSVPVTALSILLTWPMFPPVTVPFPTTITKRTATRRCPFIHLSRTFMDVPCQMMFLTCHLTSSSSVEVHVPWLKKLKMSTTLAERPFLSSTTRLRFLSIKIFPLSTLPSLATKTAIISSISSTLLPIPLSLFPSTLSPYPTSGRPIPPLTSPRLVPLTICTLPHLCSLLVAILLVSPPRRFTTGLSRMVLPTPLPMLLELLLSTSLPKVETMSARATSCLHWKSPLSNFPFPSLTALS